MKGWRGAAALPPLAVLLTPTAGAAQTRPATAIVNTAAARAAEASALSNTVTVTVAERLDVALERAPAADALLPSGERTLGVVVTNRGSGEEAIVVALAGAAGGRIVAAGDAATPLADGRTAVLAPGAALPLSVVVPAAARDPLSLAAHAATGAGAPGTVFAGQGDGGSDAVVGPTGAAAALDIALTAPAPAPPTLEKSQSVLAPDGTAAAIRGAAITYTLVARFPAAVAAADLADPIPAGTAFVPGSLRLDGAPLADAGHVAAGAVAVPLGPVPAGAVRTLRFTVVIS